MRLWCAFVTLSLLMSCGSYPTPPTAETPFAPPPAPDYADPANWAATPFSEDAADRTPGEGFTDRQAAAPADVFYVHPTMYNKVTRTSRGWNADVRDAKVNEAVDETAMLNHASIFNAAGRVFAPRYRQANIRSFRSANRPHGPRALDTAYTDVLRAFDYYLEHWNEGRPIIIASHSQGTTHCKQLLWDRFDGKPLRGQLIAAYLVGIPVSADAYATIPVCEAAEQTRCFVSWRTYRYDFEPRPSYRDTVANIAVVNPLTWTTTEERAPKELNEGGVLYNYDAGPKPELVWAERRGDGLFTSKPRFFGDVFFRTKNYHVGDYNLFWVNVRQNAVRRAEAFRARR